MDMGKMLPHIHHTCNLAENILSRQVCRNRILWSSIAWQYDIPVSANSCWKAFKELKSTLINRNVFSDYEFYLCCDKTSGTVSPVCSQPTCHVQHSINHSYYGVKQIKCY